MVLDSSFDKTARRGSWREHWAVVKVAQDFKKRMLQRELRHFDSKGQIVERTVSDGWIHLLFIRNISGEIMLKNFYKVNAQSL